MEKKVKVTINTENIPEEIKNHGKYFCLWKMIDGMKKPYSVDTYPVSCKRFTYDKNNNEVDNSSRWSDFDTAVKSFENKTPIGLDETFDGIGFIFTNEDEYWGIDLDNCISKDENGKAVFDQWAKEIIRRVNSYYEISPSGTGVKIWVKGNFSKWRDRIQVKFRILNGEKFRVEKDTPKNEMKGIDIFFYGYYFTITGRGNKNTEIKVVGEEEAKYYEELEKILTLKKEVVNRVVNEESNAKLDVEAYLLDHGVGVKKVERKGDRTYYFLTDGCLFNPEHKKKDAAIIQEWNGALGYNCFHASCSDKSWNDVRQYISGEEKLTKWMDGILQSEELDKIMEDLEEEEVIDIITTNIEFPKEVYCNDLPSRFSEVYEKGTESPREYYYFSFITAFASHITDKVVFNNEELNLYTLLVGESGVIKSAALKETINFFTDMLGTYETTIRRGREDVTIDVPNFHFLAGIGSAEGFLHHMLGRPGNIILYYDEFESFVRKGNGEGNNLIPMVSTLFTQTHFSNPTRDSQLFVNNIHLSFIGCCTPDTLQAIWKQQHSNIGLDNRFFIVYANQTEKEFAFRNKPRKEDIENLMNEVNDVYEFILNNSNKIDLYFDNEAYDLLSSWYKNYKNEKLKTNDEVYRRIDLYLRKFACIFAILDKREMVSKDDVEKAILLAEWQIKIRKEYRPITGETVLGKMENIIINLFKNKNKIWKKKQILQFSNAKKNADLTIFNRALKGLVKNNMLKEIIDRKNDKRITPSYIDINMKLPDGFMLLKNDRLRNENLSILHQK